VHYPREVIEAGPGSWDNLVGTGPFLVKEAVVGSHIVFARNPQYWRTTTIDGTEYALPFIDEMIMPNLPDETTQIASLRTGKLDIMGTVSVKYRETLADTSPDLQSQGWVEIWPVVVALNHDNEYLANKQVRRALMMAVDQEAIIDAVWGYGALYNYPVDWRDGSSILGDFKQLPEAITELYTYNPDKARQLLVDAGYPDGFKLKIAFTPAATAGTHGEIATMMAGFFEDVGVELELKSLEHTALSALRSSRTGYDLFATNSASNNPLGIIGSLASADESNPWNTPNYDNPELAALTEQAKVTVDAAERDAILKEMALMVMDEVAYIPIGASGRFVYWWPWVKNFYGEAMSGGTSVGPYLEHLWLDRALKAEMGH
jgi:peptide/nickel transport system substrate-binding protein